MTWAETLASWRDPAMWDKDDPPTEANVVEQLVFGAITDFIEQRETELLEALATDEDGDVIDRLVNDWINAQAAR